MSNRSAEIDTAYAAATFRIGSIRPGAVFTVLNLTSSTKA